MNFRFDSCGEPIHILLNGGSLAQFRQAQIGRFLQETAIEIAFLTGLEVEYTGTTNRELSRSLTDERLILIKFGNSQGGLDSVDKPLDTLRIYSAKKGKWFETQTFQVYIDTEYQNWGISRQQLIGFNEWFFGDEATISSQGKRMLMQLLGQGFGLSRLDDEFMDSNNIENTQRQSNVMYDGEYWFGELPTSWGPGDALGFFQVGRSNECF